MNWLKRLFGGGQTYRATAGCASVCPVCGVPCGLQFTAGKGKPYLACDKHKIEAILLKVHGDPRRRNKC
jgi:hypothetical protein